MHGQQKISSEQRSDHSEKKSRAGVFGEWVQTTQGIVTLIGSIIALIAGGTSAVIIIKVTGPEGQSHNPPSIIHQTTPDISTPPSSPLNSPPAPNNFYSGPASSAQLAQALLPANTLAAASSVAGSGTSLSGITGICGGALPKGAQATAYETLQDSQSGQFLWEAITYWDNAADAGTAVIESGNAIGSTGCSYSSNGVTEEFFSDNGGSPPQECGSGQYLETPMSVWSSFYFGAEVFAQCGSFTVAVQILGGVGSTVTQSTADGYLNNAVGNLQRALA